MDSLRGLLGIRRVDSPKWMDKGVVQSNKGLAEGVLQWFTQVESDRIAKGVYVGDCAGSHSVSRSRKK